jgi:predicted  nucleic acid-binding Zn-ribbon protein
MAEHNLTGEMIGRLRINESKLSTLRERLLITDSNMINEFKNSSQEVKSLNAEIREIKNEVLSLKETIQDLIKSTQNFASEQDVKVLEKYINMWNPLNFLTEKEVKKLIKEENG